MKIQVSILILVFLTGCGVAESQDSGTPGVHYDPTITDYLKARFETVKACTEFEKGSFEELSIEFVRPDLLLNKQNSQAIFFPPNIIRMKHMSYFFEHEVLHYLLYKNEGNADADHNRFPDFEHCYILRDPTV